jgi:hypothetical protein
VEEEGIKSALELAMERISALPQLTPQEIEEQRQKENAPLGTAIALKYLNGTISDAELPAELNRYEGERRQIIYRALLSSLCNEMRLENNPQHIMRSLRAVAALIPQKKSLCETAANSFGQILDEFKTAREKRISELGDLARKKLSELGIGGSAVWPNLNEDDHWKEELASIQRAYEPKLERLRNNLLEEILRP